LISVSSLDEHGSVCPLGGENARDDGTLPLVLFRRGETPAAKIVPASRWRDWMHATVDRNANRCLPLLVANQSGWVLLNPAPFSATWDGGVSDAAVTVEYPDGTPDEQRIVESHFGEGIITFIFRDVICTPPGYNLWARGPTNSPKDGVAPLEGVVETDWSAVTFTMNWKFTRPGTVSFKLDEPFCHIVPQRRGELERFRPEIRGLEDQPELEKRIGAWKAYRAMLTLGRTRAREQGEERWARYWHENYFKGSAPTGESSPEHQTTLRLAPFTDE
jgi:uncharacterized protein DUF6065